ncbi:MAG TPA: DUF4394 domain-containing protein [Pyrinomonadaceae bacterium]|jgi:hypothetical protein
MKKEFSGHSVLTVLFLLGLFFFAGAINASAVTLFGVNTSNQLVRFESETPGTLTNVGAITGLQTGENIVGIDFRPATGQLYGLGSTSRLYIINRTTAVATVIGGQFSTLLSGTDFGFDFNPTVDRIRVVANTGQNLRLNPNNGAIVAVDGPINLGTPQVTAVAYTNSFGVSTATTLYDIDTNTDRLLIQSNPNAGTLTDVGPLGVDFQNINGFDIATGNINTNPSANTAYAVTANNLGNPQLYTINLATGAATSVGSIGGVTNPVPLRGLAAATSAASPALNLLDYDGDRRADYATFRLSSSTFYINRSSNNSFFTAQFGLSDDVQTPGDYDGDGRTDIAVWRPTTGTFYVLRSTDGSVLTYRFGLNGDEPVARDYDGDGRTDFAVARRTGGQLIWYINNSANNTFRTEQFGLDTDTVAPGDYDGDARFDLAVYRGSGGNGQATFYVQRSTLGFTAVNFGLGSDTVVPGDYDGDGKTDYAVLRGGSQFTWYVLFSGSNSFSIVNFGAKPDYAAQGDYDGDGKTDYAVYEPLNGLFYVLRATGGAVIQRQFGQNGDYPVANYDSH